MLSSRRQANAVCWLWPRQHVCPVATHDTLLILIAFASGHNLKLEGKDLSNAYLYGKIDIPLLIEQQKDSSRVPPRPVYVRGLVISMYVWNTLSWENIGISVPRSFTQLGIHYLQLWHAPLFIPWRRRPHYYRGCLWLFVLRIKQSTTYGILHGKVIGTIRW